jgi:hypothetical protein
MNLDIVAAIASNDLSVTGTDFEELLQIFGQVAGEQSSEFLLKRLSHQVLRSIEMELLSDPAILDIALNAGLYLGRETTILKDRLSDLLKSEPPTAVVQYFRTLVLSGNAGTSRKGSIHSLDRFVFERYRASNRKLHCLDCGYHFIEEDLGRDRLDLAQQLGLSFATEKLARRLRDPWKPFKDTGLSIDHIIPEAGLGPSSIENLRIVCAFCNRQKQIYRWPGETSGRCVAAALLGLGDLSRGSWSIFAVTYITIIDSGGVCALCEMSSSETELTARPLAGRGNAPTLPWRMEAVCYGCYDPAS